MNGETNNNFSHWRSPLESFFADGANETQWADCGDSRIVESFSGETENPAAGICDLSPFLRAGAKGAFADNAPPPNTFIITETAEAENSLCCRLSADEVFVLATSPDANAAIPESVIPSPRILIPRRDSHCQIGLCGAAARAVLARLCAVPPPSENELLQTRVAEVSALVVCESRIKENAFYLLSDSGYALHLWNAVVAAADKVGGGIIGWKQWRTFFAVSESESAKSPKTKKGKK